ncbi:MAG: ABC transporter ATP-binding protein [Ignavibacteria bacterium]|nr:MAG: ABC transporter ATP-binding protein [Ignavibacteria bacterium]
MTDNDKIIEVKGLTKKFGNLTAVNSLDLNVYRGDVFGFLGPNGAGKSTTIRMLLSLIKPTKGKIKIFGMDLKHHRNEILARIGAIVEKPDLYKYLTAYKNLEILGRISGVDVSKKRIMEMLELVGLAERANSKVKTFSHGMKQRLGIAQALLHDPELIILDEPTTGLDPQGMKEIRDMILHLSQDKRKTIFLSSHILREVELIATRMIIINKGQTQVEGKVEDLLASDEMEVKVDIDEPDLAISAINESKWKNSLISSNKNQLVFKLNNDDVPKLNKYLVLKNVTVRSFVPTRSLEEYFLKITEGGTE